MCNCRRFYWSDVNLWPHELPRHTMLVIAHGDRFMHAPELLDMCSKVTSAEVLYHKSLSHAEFLFAFSWQEDIMAGLMKLMQRVQHVQRHRTWSRAELEALVSEAKKKLK